MKTLISVLNETKSKFNYSISEKDENILYVILEYFIRNYEKGEDLMKFSKVIAKSKPDCKFTEDQLGKFLVNYWESITGTSFDRDLPY